MKVSIWKDERYPDYGISSSNPEIEIDDEFYAEYKKVEALYDEMQNKLEKLYKNS